MTTQNQEHVAGGLNEDWPVGRGVFIQDSRDFIVLVNFEDHLKLIVLPGKESDLIDGLSRMIKSLHTFEQLTYSTD